MFSQETAHETRKYVRKARSVREKKDIKAERISELNLAGHDSPTIASLVPPVSRTVYHLKG